MSFQKVQQTCKFRLYTFRVVYWFFNENICYEKYLRGLKSLETWNATAQLLKESPSLLKLSMNRLCLLQVPKK